MNKTLRNLNIMIAVSAVGILAVTSNCLGGNALNAGTNQPVVLSSANDPLFAQPASGSWPGAVTNGGASLISMQRMTNRLRFTSRQEAFGTNQSRATAVPRGARSVLTAQMNAARERMISEQLVARGITNQAVLAAMRKVPRLLPYEVATNMFEDKPVDIQSKGSEMTIDVFSGGW